jgi:hypothetical protein
MIMVVSLPMFLVVPASAIIVPFSAVSFAFGFSWAATMLSVRAQFAKDVGKHYSSCYIGTIAGIVCLNHFMFGNLFDQVGQEQGVFPECNGKACISMSIWVLTGLAASAIASTLFVHWSFRRLKRENNALSPTVQEMFLNNVN